MQTVTFRHTQQISFGHPLAEAVSFAVWAAARVIARVMLCALIGLAAMTLLWILTGNPHLDSVQDAPWPPTRR